MDFESVRLMWKIKNANAYVVIWGGHSEFSECKSEIPSSPTNT